MNTAPGQLILVCVVFLRDYATGCEAYSCTTYGYGIFNVPTKLGALSISVFA